MDEFVSKESYGCTRHEAEYVAPTVRNGEKIKELCKDEIETETVRWKHALILYVVGAEPTIASIE